MLNSIVNNPYRVLGVLSNSPLKERLANQNRLNAFSKVGKICDFPNDFSALIDIAPNRTAGCISSAKNAINLDKDQAKYALLWFVNGSAIDAIALKHLQTGNTDKAIELFSKKETFSSLINFGVLLLIQGKSAEGFAHISKVIHSDIHRRDFFHSLGLDNLLISEDDLAQAFIEILIQELPAKQLLQSGLAEADRNIIELAALKAPVAQINSAISVAKNVNSKDAAASLAAGIELMNSTKEALLQISSIVGTSNPQYQTIADNLAKQILQCGINYYNNAPDTDVESPRKAMVLQEYALKIAVGKLAKDRCQQNYDVLKKAVDEMPPASVAVEARQIKEELRKFCKLPDKICHSVTLLSNTRPILEQIKRTLGVNNSFYLAISTQVVGNALHNIIEEVNQAQNYFAAVVEAIKKSGLDPQLLNYLDDEHSPARIIDTKVKPVIREAWKATTIMDSFDMESEFRTKRYNPNRESLKEMCTSLHISTSTPRPNTHSTSTPASRTTPRQTTNTTTSSSSTSNSNTSTSNNGWPAFWIATLICAVIGAMVNGTEGFFCGGIIGAIFIGNIAKAIFSDN